MGIYSFVSSVALVGGFAAVVFQPSMAADQMGGDTRTGSAKVTLQYVYGLQQNGSHDPAHDAACKKQLSSINSNYMGMPVTTKYSINTKSLMMSATSSFPSPQSTTPLELNVQLSALGIAGSYSFGTFKPAVLPDVYSVLFSISKQFNDAKSSFVVFGPKGQTYNCLISSAPAPFKTPESAKFRME